MADLVVLLTGVSCVLAAAWFVADVLFRSRPEVQDLVWRAALVLVAGLPIAWLARTVVPHVVVESPAALNIRTEPVDVARSEGQPSDRPEPVPNPIQIADSTIFQPAITTTSKGALPGTQPLPESSADPANGHVVRVASRESLAPAQWIRVETVFSVLFPVAALIWLAGTVWSLANLLRGAFRLRILVRESEVAGETWQRRLDRAAAFLRLPHVVQMRMSAQISSPLVAGLRNPVLLWPSNDIEVFDEQSCDEMLVHELAHIRRGDLWTNLLLQLTTAVWWPHPLVQLMRNRLCWLREILCDAAVSLHGDRTHYAETLLQVATRPAASPLNCGQLAIEPRGGTLEARISSVLNGGATRWVVSKMPVRIAWACMTGLFIAVASLHFAPTQAAALMPMPGDEKGTDDTSEETQPQTVIGRVLSPDGQTPMTEGTVYLLQNPDGHFTLPTQPLKTTVNDKGEFTFENVEPAGYRIWAETKSLTSLKKKLGGHRFKVEPAKAVEPIALLLHSGCNYQVTVRSAATGNPVANAEITFGWTDIVRSYRTDADGVADIGGLGVANWYFVIRADRHATSFKKIPEQPLGSTTPLTFDLEPGGKVFGQVTTPDGDPVANARVTASIVGPAMTPNLNRTHTDATGRYELKNMPLNQRFRVMCSPDDFERNDQELAVSEEQRTLRHDLTLIPRKYAGDGLFTVLNEDGEPISDATLINQGNSSAHVREGITNKEGECRLQKLYDSYRGVTVVAKAEGYIPKRAAVKPGTAESPAEQTIELQRGKRLLGRLLKPDGSPAAGVRVYYNQGEHGELEGGRVETHTNGLFEITGLPEKSVFTVYTPIGFAPIEDVSLPVGQSDPVDIVMEPEGILVVRAVDANTGDPIAEYNVRVGFSRDRRPGDPSGASMASSLADPGQNVMGSKKQFRHGGFQPGLPLQVTVSAEGYERQVFPRVEAAPAADGEVLIAKLSPADPSSLIKVAGRLLNDEGKPVEGALLQLVVGAEDPSKGNWKFYHWDNLKRGNVARAPQCLQFLSATTDSGGRFLFDGVKDAPWLELFRTGGGMAPTRHRDLRKMSNDLSKLELRTVAAGSVKVEVDSKVWPQAEEVRIQSEAYPDNSGNSSVAFSYSSGRLRSDRGSVEFSDLPPGLYKAWLRGKDIDYGDGSFGRAPLDSKPFDVESGKTTTIKFD